MGGNVDGSRRSLREIVIAVLVGAALMLGGGWSWLRAHLAEAPREEASRAPAGAAPSRPLPPPAVAEETRAVFIAEPEAFVRKEPSRRSEALARLKMGQEVPVSREPQTGQEQDVWHQVLSGPGAGGYLSAEEVSTERPSAEQALQRAREALGEGKLDEVVRQAERAAALDESSREAWDLLAAVHDARQEVQQARRVYALRAALPALPKPPEEQPAWEPPSPGQKRYVSGTRLRVREAASRSAKALSELTLNTEVDILAVEGEFARVRWTTSSQPQWILDLTEETAPRRVDSGTQMHEGYAAVAFLAPQPWTIPALMAQADRAEAEGHMLDAARALERAAWLDAHPETLKRLLRASAKAGLFPLAALTAVKLAQAPAASGQPAVAAQLELLFGCEKEPPLESAASCLEHVDTVGQCPPCAPTDIELSTDDEMSKQERARLEKEYQRNVAKHEQAMAEHEAALAKLTQQAEQLRGRYPSGPWLHAVLEGDDALANSGMRVVVYAVSFNIGGYCGNYEAQRGEPQVSGSAIPWPRKGETLELWARGGDYRETLWGIVAAKDSADAAARFAQGGPYGEMNSFQGDPKEFGPQPNVPGPYAACIDCCGC